ncbi:hypothetical protein FH966_14820 [Lentibacillus cibarius]|uniref:Uncharacterized protein n=1 Tax=Lentibacillus cibarius TaxID=2583219 RepID=A0A549YLV8_9BACI|nr:hypothetical protein [Lentibacillus cibarius]TRM08773.1 hypothetical protein FH966_16485 [Lentibacillus cibarius]TRM08801.1 hypothetical protein FH966_16635 [Lentibacillus cibarius]TRM12875.1 hypothetical protein FH966_14820 [Lentibacillus cibarius]
MTKTKIDYQKLEQQTSPEFVNQIREVLRDNEITSFKSEENDEFIDLYVIAFDVKCYKFSFSRKRKNFFYSYMTVGTINIFSDMIND